MSAPRVKPDPSAAPPPPTHQESAPPPAPPPDDAEVFNLELWSIPEAPAPPPRPHPPAAAAAKAALPPVLVAKKTKGAYERITKRTHMHGYQFLPKGNSFLTRRTKALSEAEGKLWFTVRKDQYGKKLGLLVTRNIMATARRLELEMGTSQKAEHKRWVEEKKRKRMEEQARGREAVGMGKGTVGWGGDDGYMPRAGEAPAVPTRRSVRISAAGSGETASGSPTQPAQPARVPVTRAAAVLPKQQPPAVKRSKQHNQVPTQAPVHRNANKQPPPEPKPKTVADYPFKLSLKDIFPKFDDPEFEKEFLKIPVRKRWPYIPEEYRVALFEFLARKQLYDSYYTIRRHNTEELHKSRALLEAEYRNEDYCHLKALELMKTIEELEFSTNFFPQYRREGIHRKWVSWGGKGERLAGLEAANGGIKLSPESVALLEQCPKYQQKRALQLEYIKTYARLYGLEGAKPGAPSEPAKAAEIPEAETTPKSSSKRPRDEASAETQEKKPRVQENSPPLPVVAAASCSSSAAAAAGALEISETEAAPLPEPSKSIQTLGGNGSPKNEPVYINLVSDDEDE
ncbi:hypothetical protein DFH27DRAFT_53119 [Peziza echinospora]|nr:hypothetical protein DFH27DRAFT_53119 [Peziza echinospora]